MKHYIIGIDLGGTKIHTAIADERRDIISSVQLATGVGKDTVLNNIFHSIETVTKQSHLSLEQVHHIGIGVPGPVDYDRGVVRVCPNIPGWQEIPVKEILTRRFPHTQVAIENDARAAGLAEARRGAGKGFRHVFYTTLSTGIGGAIIIDGNIYHGAHGAAGEVGHMRFENGKEFEELASGPAVHQLFGIHPQELATAVSQGNPKAQAALDHLVRITGTGLGNVVTLLNPGVIIIGGGLSNLGSLYLKPLEKKIRQEAFSIGGSEVQVKKAGLGNESGVIGAIETCFTDSPR